MFINMRIGVISAIWCVICRQIYTYLLECFSILNSIQDFHYQLRRVPSSDTSYVKFQKTRNSDHKSLREDNVCKLQKLDKISTFQQIVCLTGGSIVS